MAGAYKKEICFSKSLIHFSFDIWTSPNLIAMIAIVAHYVSNMGEAKDCLLGLKRVLGAHTGENMAWAVITTIEDYGLSEQIGRSASSFSLPPSLPSSLSLSLLF